MVVSFPALEVSKHKLDDVAPEIHALKKKRPDWIGNSSGGESA
jgi:hypothetical protein